jgi:hypothetical protein
MGFWLILMYFKASLVKFLPKTLEKQYMYAINNIFPI